MNPQPVYKVLPKIDLNTPPFTNKFILTYKAYYQLNFSEVTHHIGTIDCNQYTITVQVFSPANIKGTLFLVHGLFDHSPYYKNIINLCNCIGIATCLIDLPGHGLSSGKPVEVDTFHSYGFVLQKLISTCSKTFPPPYHLLGHSTGCSAIVDFLYRYSDAFILHQIILLAPLVRSAHWKICRLFFPLFSQIHQSLPRVKRKTSSDFSFLEQIRNDPLQHRHLPLSWYSALVNWNVWLHTQCRTDKNITIIQGTEDTVVDWKFNIRVLNNFFLANTIEIPGAKHHLHNECEEIRSKVLSIIQNKLII